MQRILEIHSKIFILAKLHNLENQNIFQPCHVVMCSCHKLLMSRKLSRGCVTCCPDQGPMCTGSDAPLVTPRLSLRMRGSDQQVVARARLRSEDSFTSQSSYCHWPHPHSPSHSAFRAKKDAKCQCSQQQLVIRLTYEVM